MPIFQFDSGSAGGDCCAAAVQTTTTATITINDGNAILRAGIGGTPQAGSGVGFAARA